MHTLLRLLIAMTALASPVFAIDKPLGAFSRSGATSSGIYANPNLRGVLIRASWSDIEPTPGTFNFTSIASQVANAKANGKPWSLAVIGGGTGSPAWLTDPVASGGLGAPFITYSFRGVPGYKLPLFWNAIVQDRLAQLANALAAQYNGDPDLKLVYVTQMTANGIEGHLQGVTMSTLIAAGNDRDGDSDVDAADFQIAWVEASKQASRSFAYAFTNKAVAFEVHDVNNTATIPEIIINDLWNDPTLGQRVGAAMWWISGKTSYQPALITVLSNFPGDIYGQVIGKSGEGPWLPGTSYSTGTFRMPVNLPATQRFRYEVTTAGVTGGTEPVWPTTINATVTDGSVVWTCRDSRFEDGDFATVFAQAKTIGMRYIEPWEWEFKYGANSADGEWDAVLADFNAWAEDSVYAVLPAGQIAEVARLADGRVQLRLLGPPGQYFSLETSTDLTAWTEMGRNTFATGEFICTDTNAIGAERRFYRWRSLPKPCFTCTQVIGYSQVGAANGWYVRDGVFESIVDDNRWQLLWNGGGGVDLWQDPNYVGWSNALVSPCPTNSATPDRVILSISGTYGEDEAAWAAAIEATIETIKQKLPSARRIILQPVVGGLNHETCTISGTDVRASWQHKHIDNAIATVVQARFGTLPEVVPGFSPEVQSCADYADTLGHFTPAGAVSAAQAIGQYYAGIDSDCCPGTPLPPPAGGP